MSSLHPVHPNSVVKIKPILTDLQDTIEYLEKCHSDISHKKAIIYRLALQRFMENYSKEDFQCYRLRDRRAFVMNSVFSPPHFDEKFISNTCFKVKNTPSSYTYQSEKSNCDEYYIVFASPNFGGYCFNKGNFQEEQIIASMPEVAQHIAANLNRTGFSTITVRNGDLACKHEVSKGSPNPYLMKRVHCVQEICNLYGRAIDKVNVQEILQHIKPINPPQLVNLLAIAPPKLEKNDPEIQWNINTLKDIYNTIFAGFTLAKENSSREFAIHSGKFDAESFNNDDCAVYLLHCLAAEHMKIHITMYNYSAEESKEYLKIWITLRYFCSGMTIKKIIEFIAQRYWIN